MKNFLKLFFSLKFWIMGVICYVLSGLFVSASWYIIAYTQPIIWWFKFIYIFLVGALLYFSYGPIERKIVDKLLKR